MDKLVTGTFETRTAAEAAIRDLETNGFRDEQISLIVSDDTRKAHFGAHDHDDDDAVEDNAEAGAASGGLVGAIVGAVAAAPLLAIPGTQIVAAGALILAGIAGGAITGGIVGALVGLGVPKAEAEMYKQDLNNGRVLVMAKPANDVQHSAAKNIFDKQNAYNVAA